MISHEVLNSAAAAASATRPPSTLVPAYAETRATFAPTDYRTQNSGTWAAVASRRCQPPPHTSIDDACLDVRVSSFRHHNHDFPLEVRVKIFHLASEAYTALRDMGRAKASLPLARDLASKKRSSLCPEIVDFIFALCDAVCWVFSINAAQGWFQNRIPTARDTTGWRHRPQADFYASDSSVEVQRQRRRDDPSSGEKSKRVMMALTTDSDIGPDSPRGTDRGIRLLRQVSPRVYRAHDPNDGTAPSFPPRIARIRGQRRIALPRPMPRSIPAPGNLSPTQCGAPILE